MKTELMPLGLPRIAVLLAASALFAAGSARAQVPVDENGEPLATIDETTAPDASAAAAAGDPAYSDEELETLVGPIALYPDDLLAIVLPASTYPLEIVQAARFLEELETDSSLEPNESWDEAVVALLNYPEVVEMMNEDLDWTWKLGEAVVAQQPDVISAIERFRDRAYAAGNLQSDGYQTVERNDEGAIEIETVEDEIIYVPYYEPERVVVYQPRPVYFYYPQAYPVYYYPYPAHYRFPSGYFWGVTTAFRIGWSSHHLHVFHPTYWGHPYYGRHYFGHWYRQPSISIFNSYYVNHHLRRSHHRHRDGDFWRPRRVGGPRPGHYRERVARYREPRLERTREGYRDGSSRQIVRESGAGQRLDRRSGFRGNATRDAAGNAAQRRGFAASRERAERRAGSGDDDTAIRFRPRQRSAGTSGAVTTTRPAERRAVEDSSSARGRMAAPPSRRSVAPRTRSSEENRRADPPARISRPPATRAAPRVTTPQRSATPRSRAAAPRGSASAPRATARPRASAPRASAPRASAPRASAPRQASRPAPARQSRAAPSRPSSGTRSRNGTRTREH